MPPDPGEPHEPLEEDFDTWDAYLEAVDAYVELMNPPQEKRIKREAIELSVAVEKFLKEQSDH